MKKEIYSLFFLFGFMLLGMNLLAQTNPMPFNLLGVNERLSSATAFSIYPNPAKEEFKVRMNGNQSDWLVVTIYDILGNKVYSSSQLNNVIATDKFANGYYIVELLNKNTNQSSFNKLIIQK